MRAKKLVTSALLGAGLGAMNVFAASALNNNVRIFEDTLWVITFLLMITLGLLMKNISHGHTKKGYIVLTIAGVSGILWKGIGLVKRVLIQKEPVWLFDVARETFEGLTGIILAVAFVLLIYSLVKIFKK